MINCTESRGPAFENQAKEYPWPGRVPVRVRMNFTVHADWPLSTIRPPHLTAEGGKEYDAYTNRYGAVSVWLGDKLLGVKPREFEVVEFCEMQAE